MTNNQQQIDQLLSKLEILLKKQENFSKEIDAIREELNQLRRSVTKPIEEKEEIIGYQTPQKQTSKETPKHIAPKITQLPKIKSNLEKFIGENLINKIGIAITIIGVAIGANYTIEHKLLSPQTRIMLGFLIGAILLGVGLKLKKNYKNYSAVLVSGAMAIMYFITYSAHSFYDLIPQISAFILMLIFTTFTVLVAINYNRQIIAHIGMVGAYAVPFLLSEGSGKVIILFSYMAIINVGILVIAFKKYWKLLYYSSFLLTWLIYFYWYTSKYQATEQFELAFTFLIIYFAIFYLTFLAYKLLQKERFEIDDIFLLLANSFIFYGIGYGILTNQHSDEHLLGIFTISNAIIHSIISIIIYQQKLTDRNLYYFISGLALVFITIAIPIHLNGNWVTLLWAGEAALLFWIGRTKNVDFYEKISYPLMILAFFSIGLDWATAYNIYNPEYPETRITPLLNINFLTSLFLIAALGLINSLNQNKKYPSPLINQKGILRIVSFTIPAILLLTVYYAFRIEIATYWNQMYADSTVEINSEVQQYTNYTSNGDLQKFKIVWILNYSLLFLTGLSYLNFKKLKSQRLGIINLALNTLAIVAFLTQGLYCLSELRESYLAQTLSEHYYVDNFNVVIRYISFTFVAVLLTASYKYILQEFMKVDFKTAFDFLLHTTILWILSSEWINWMDIAESTQSNKLGLTILWGVYALLLIVLGIWRKKRHMRVGAIALFAFTLIKLFSYDISHLETIAKTIVFVSLGILLLIISFLYNKYKHIISDEVES